MVGLEETLRITEPWNQDMFGLERTLRIIESWDHGVVGLEGTVNLQNHRMMEWLGWKGT